jgi:hypothetical protein
MRTAIKCATLAGAIAITPVWGATPERPVSIKDPAQFAAVLRDMGYQPGEFTKGTKNPAFIVTIGDQATRITFGGCVGGAACKYIYLSSSYSDVPNPPKAFLDRMNDQFDIIKVDTDADNDLFFSATHVIEGVPRTTLKLILDMWVNDANALAQEAVSAKLTTGN